MEECFSQVCDLSVRLPRMADKGRCRQPLMILQSLRRKAVFSSFWWKLKLTVTMFRLLKWGSNCTTAKEKLLKSFEMWFFFFKPYLQDLIKANRDDQADVKPSHSQTNFLSIFFFELLSGLWRLLKCVEIKFESFLYFPFVFDQSNL